MAFSSAVILLSELARSTELMIMQLSAQLACQTKPNPIIYGLASHTPQSQGKRGLVIMRTTSCTGDKILSRPIRFEILNLLLSNALLVAVVCDVFCN